MRKIFIKRPDALIPIQIETDVTTFGELKTLVEFNMDDYVCIARETMNTLTLNDAILPEGNFVIIMYKKAQKGAADVDYSKMSYNELRKECKNRDSIKSVKGSYGSADEMRKALAKDDKKKISKDTKKETVKETIQKASKASEPVAKTETATEGITAFTEFLKARIVEQRAILFKFEAELLKYGPKFDEKAFLASLNEVEKSIYKQLKDKRLVA